MHSKPLGHHMVKNQVSQNVQNLHLTKIIFPLIKKHVGVEAAGPETS
jgi:hypothetical protein